MHSSVPRGRGLLLACGAALAAAGAALLLRPAAAPRPNLVLVVWDTCRADRLSAYGHAAPTTPHLEAFARTGVRFRNAFAPAPWTAPAHASLFTGLLPSRHGLTQGTGSEARVRPGVPLLAETLSAAGYETMGITANAFLSPATGLDQGFGRMVALHRGERVKGRGERALEEVRAWLGARRADGAAAGRPFLLFVNLMETHVPWNPAPAALGPVLDGEVPEGALAAARALGEEDLLFHTVGIRKVPEETLAGARALYDGGCREADGVTKGILDLLEAEGLLAGSLVAITSDHGEALGEHGEMGHRYSVHDTVLRIPLVVRWPGRLEGGRVEDAQVRLQDLYPTLLEAAGVEAPPGNGLDAATLTERPLRPRTVIAQFHRPPLSMASLLERLPGAPAEALERLFHSHIAVQDPVGTTGARKWVRVTRQVGDGPRTTVREELYDLLTDPMEQRNLLLLGGDPEERAAAERLRRAGGEE